MYTETYYSCWIFHTTWLQKRRLVSIGWQVVDVNSKHDRAMDLCGFHTEEVLFSSRQSNRKLLTMSYFVCNITTWQNNDILPISQYSQNKFLASQTFCHSQYKNYKNNKLKQFQIFLLYCAERGRLTPFPQLQKTEPSPLCLSPCQFTSKPCSVFTNISYKQNKRHIFRQKSDKHRLQ